MKAKIVFSLFLFVLVISSLSAQVRYVRNIPIQLPLTYLYEPKYTPKQIFPTPDGGVIILGDCLAYYGDWPEQNVAGDCGAIKLDAYGNCEWQWWSRNFIGWGGPAIVGIDQEADGSVNFIINNPPFYKQKGWISQLGNQSIQTISFPDAGINKAIRLPNGDIFAIGGHNSTHLTDAFFMHLSPQGDTLSTRRYPPDSLWIHTGGAAAFDMELDTDGMPVSTCQFTDRFASVVKTDWDGNLIWRRDTNLQVGGIPFPITKIPATNELVFGYLTEIGPVYNQYVIYKVTATGIDSLFYFNSFGPWRSIVGYDQGICTGGSIAFSYVGISNYDLQGQAIWSWSSAWCYDGTDQADRIIAMPDSSIMYVYSANIFDSFLSVVKLSPQGTANEDESIPYQQSCIKIWPNPMRDIVKIELQSESVGHRHSQAGIYNIKGQLVKKLNLTSKFNVYTTSWNGTDEHGMNCSSGIYLFKYHVGNNIIAHKIIRN